MSIEEEQGQQEAPHISVVSQYIKDFSFENPGAPNSLGKLSHAPMMDLSVDLSITRLPEEDFFEVEILFEAKASYEEKTLFVVDLRYAGVFNLINMPEEQKEIILAVHCPAILFPFARRIIADVTASGGFQPLMIDPIDFGMLYSKKLRESN